MKQYTVRFAHLDKDPEFLEGETIRRGDIVGRMGNTGASQGAHLHIDCVYGEEFCPWRLGNVERMEIKPAFRQLNYFIDDELFLTPIHITTAFNDPDYMTVTGKIHTAFDVVPEDRHETEDHYKLHWNRSHPGTVTYCGYDVGYGWCLLVTFSA